MEFGHASQLPAIFMATPDTAGPTPATAAGERILSEFLSNAQPPENPPPTTDESDAAWNAAAARANEQFRGIFGKEAYLRHSLEAARHSRLPTEPAPAR